MPEVISSSDAAFVPLRKLDLFKGAIPSKIFENLAMKKPLILGVEGEAKQLFIDEAKAGIFYEPENAESLAAAIRQMKASDENRSTMGEHGRQYVLAHFNRKELAKSLADALEQL